MSDGVDFRRAKSGDAGDRFDEEDARPRYEVQLTDEAFYAYSSLPGKRLFDRLDRDLELLETTPYIGREYDPAYDASRPPFPCRVLYCGCYGIYYRVYEESFRVVVFAIVDQRRDPLSRFAGFEYGAGRLD